MLARWGKSPSVSSFCLNGGGAVVGICPIGAHTAGHKPTLNMTQVTDSGAQLVPVELIRKATDIASVCKAIVEKTAMTIQDKKYVKVEGWMSIATAHGCVASAGEVQYVPKTDHSAGGFRAVGEIRRIDNGQVIATAEGFVGEDEPTWFGGHAQTSRGPKFYEKRADYAIRAMAQTRAVSRACRTAFAHVVVMMDAGLQTTPAEEVPTGGFEDRSDHATPQQSAEPKQAKPVEVPRENGAYKLPEGVKWQDVKVHFGKNKGIPLGKLEDSTISWYAEKWEPKPYGTASDISNDDKMLLAAVNAWADEQDARDGKSA